MVDCNTMRHRGERLRTPVLTPLSEAILRDKIGRVGPLPSWAYDEFDDEPDADTYWDRMVYGDLT